jgi:hypothetical protein
MKRITAIALLAIANFALAGTSFAQSKVVQADVPFDFTVSNKLLPAGTYRIQRDSNGFILIENRDKPFAALSVVRKDENKAANGGKLIFHTYAGQYFLSEILDDRANMNVTVPASKAEKILRNRQQTVEPGSQTFVAAR